MASQDSDGSELELAMKYSEVLAEMDDEDDRVLNAIWAQAKANKEYRVATGYYRGSSSCQSTPIRKRQAVSPATTSDGGRRAARRSSADAAASADGSGAVFDLAVYNGNYLETAPDGSDRFGSVSVQLDSSVPSLFDMRREIAHLINERCTAKAGVSTETRRVGKANSASRRLFLTTMLCKGKGVRVGLGADELRRAFSPQRQRPRQRHAARQIDSIPM